MKLVVVLVLIGAVVGLGIFLSSKANTSKVDEKLMPTAQPVQKVNKVSLIQKSTSEINDLVEIPNRDKAKVFQVNNVKALVSVGEIFKKAYKGDLVVLLPDKTIIYDPSTKTIRDISNEILYESF